MKAVETILATAIVAVWLSYVEPEKIKDGDSCAAVIDKLAFMDEKFSNRRKQKIASIKDKKTGKLVANIPSNPEEISSRANGAVSRDGVAPKCGETADWIMDVFRGTAFLTDPEKQKTGESLKKLFVAASTLKDRHIVYHAALVGSKAEHAFVIEQTPVSGKDPEYRIYQSYMGAYSLAAWLSPNDPAKLPTRDEHIYLNYLTRCGVPKEADLPAECKQDPDMESARQAYLMLKKTTGKLEKDWVASFEKKTKADAKKSFEKAWKVYGGGKGRSLTKAEFMDGKDSFLEKLVLVLQFIKAPPRQVVTPANMELYEEIFGAPLFYVLPNQPKVFLLDDLANPGRLSVDDFVLTRKPEDQKNHCVAEGRKIGGPTA